MGSSQGEIRRLFWESFPNLDKGKIQNDRGDGMMYKADARCAFIEFVDALEKNGTISERLAAKVTL